MILLRNKLVFHNFEWSSTLFIHLSPAMASAGIHWNREKVSETWGDRFENYTEVDGWEVRGCFWMLRPKPSNRNARTLPSP